MILVLAIFASSMFTPNLLDDFNGEGEAAEGADLVSKRFDIASASSTLSIGELAFDRATSRRSVHSAS